MNDSNNTMELVPADTGEPMKRADLPAIWEDFRTRAVKLKATAESLTVTDISQVAEMKLAKETRLALRDIRTAATKKHAELKADALDTCQKLDKGKRELLALIEPLELRLEDQEKFGEREAARLQQLKREARTAEISPFLSGPLAMDLGVMLDAGYAALLADTKAAHAARIERESKEAEEAAAKLKADAEERERIRLEIERLKKEAAEKEASLKAERERVAKEQAEAAEKASEEREAAEKIRRDLEAKAAQERADAEAERARLTKQFEDEQKAAQARADAETAKIRKDAAERERLAAEKVDKARKERAAIEAKARAEREAREAEIAAKKAAEEAVAAEARRAAEKAAAAPDKEKLLALADTLLSLPFPALATPAARRLAVGVRDTIYSIADELAKDARLL